MRGTSQGPRILGLSGGTAPVRPPRSHAADNRVRMGMDTYHDAAAVLVCGGEVCAAVEEERLNRVKHTNRFAARAIRACLDIGTLAIEDVDRIAYYVREDVFDLLALSHALGKPQVPAEWTGRSYLSDTIAQDLGCDIDPARLVFVEHHRAHAISAYAVGPFADALVVTIDGNGDNLAATVWAGCGGTLTRLLDVPMDHSLGRLYLEATRYLGFGLFDEYKVMGLAAYGDPCRFRPLFDRLCTCESGGRYKVHLAEIVRARQELPPPRRSDEPITRVHSDFAAAAQEAVERATTHMVTHYRRETRLRHLCLAGGVAQNSTMVGKIARSGLFDGVFVQPAAYDAGCALGAALAAHQDLAPDIRICPIAHVYWGPDVGDRDSVGDRLEAWSAFVHVRRADDVAGEAAERLAAGEVIGWVQGRSEFGPRALGNRSILADPRPAANKDRVNTLVKQRDAYRPFAPAVLAEYAGHYFELPPGTRADFMTLTVPVRVQARDSLGAVTHVDGTARVQTVSRATNPRFWSLIDAFRQRTGVPVLLNTSFNHSVEPIVQSVDDAVTCLLTTGLNSLIVDDYVVTKREGLCDRLWTLVPNIPDYVRVVHARQPVGEEGYEDIFRCEHHVTPAQTRQVSGVTCRALQKVDGRRSLEALCEGDLAPSDRSIIATEVEQLWTARLLRLVPVVE